MSTDGSAMTSEANDTGLYKCIKCPNCGHTVSLTIMVYQLPSHKKKIKGLIENVLPYQEFKIFREFKTIEKIIFAIGKFYDSYGRWPSEKELSKFIGLTAPTISKYTAIHTALIASKPQERGINGLFENKSFCLTSEGKNKYSELTYQIQGYAQSF